MQNLTNTATWSSSASGVATISAAGVAKGVGVGSSTITATLGSVTGSTTLSVGAATLASIAVTPANESIPAGSPLQFDALGTYSDGSTQDLTLAAAWNSSSTGVATITSGGLAMGVAAGNSTISAKVGSVTGSTGLTVTVATSNPVTAPDWLEFVGDGSEGAYSCSGACKLQGEHWYSSFEVASGGTLVTNDANNPIVIRSTGTCSSKGTSPMAPIPERAGIPAATAISEPEAEEEAQVQRPDKSALTASATRASKSYWEGSPRQGARWKWEQRQ